MSCVSVTQISPTTTGIFTVAWVWMSNQSKWSNTMVCIRPLWQKLSQTNSGPTALNVNLEPYSQNREIGNMSYKKAWNYLNIYWNQRMEPVEVHLFTGLPFLRNFSISVPAWIWGSAMRLSSEIRRVPGAITRIHWTTLRCHQIWQAGTLYVFFNGGI